MEEELVFERIHSALDVQPPPGAYERLRVALNQRPVKPPRWPAFSTRWSNMSFRLAAGVALVALAAAILAAIFAIHNASTGYVPAGSGMSIQAYEAMVINDNAAALATFSGPCDIGVHTACLADATRGIPAVQKWIDDLTHAQTPSRFKVVDAEMRRHLAQNLTAQHDLVAAAQAGDGAAMDRAFIVAVYAAAWTDTIISQGVTSSRQVDVPSYVAVVQARQLGNCDTCTLVLSGKGNDCVTANSIPCLVLFDQTAVAFAEFEAALVHSAAPASLSAKDSKLQNDLAQADSVLLTMRLAVAANDQAGFNSGVTELQRVVALIARDSNAITQGG